jgi:hypothetical protein
MLFVPISKKNPNEISWPGRIAWRTATGHRTTTRGYPHRTAPRQQRRDPGAGGGRAGKPVTDAAQAH